MPSAATAEGAVDLAVEVAKEAVVAARVVEESEAAAKAVAAALTVVAAEVLGVMVVASSPCVRHMGAAEAGE